jgi:hypothetical protein
MKSLSQKRRFGLAHFEDAVSEAFRSEIAGSNAEAIDCLMQAQSLYTKGSALVEPINPSTEKALLDEQKRVGNLVEKARAKLKKRVG